MGKDLTENTKKYEYFKDIVIPNGIGFVIRLDGSNFSSFTKDYKKPFDNKFNELMKYITKSVMDTYSEIYESTTHSDEISFYFKETCLLFDRRLEKLLSEFAGFASALLVSKTSKIGHFDARVILTPSLEIVKMYRKDRWLDAFRGCVNGVTYWGLRNKGFSKKRATSQLMNMKSREKQELAFQQLGINVSKLPSWQKQGNRFVWTEYEKDGINPLTNEKVRVTRRKIEGIGFNYLD